MWLLILVCYVNTFPSYDLTLAFMTFTYGFSTYTTRQVRDLAVSLV